MKYEAPPAVIQVNEDKTVLGLKDGKLYRGTPKRLCFDEIEVKVEAKGDIIRRWDLYGGHVLGHTELHKDGFVADRTYVYAASMTQAKAKKLAEQDWEAQKVEERHRKHYLTAMNPEGELMTVEATKLVYDWVEA